MEEDTAKQLDPVLGNYILKGINKEVIRILIEVI